MTYEELMKDQQVDCIQIAVHSTNEKALNFWTSLGFIKFNERTYESKVIFSFEKKLSYNQHNFINVNTNMYIFARLRMYKITRFLRLNDALIGMNHRRL